MGVRDIKQDVLFIPINAYTNLKQNCLCINIMYVSSDFN